MVVDFAKNPLLEDFWQNPLRQLLFRHSLAAAKDFAADVVLPVTVQQLRMWFGNFEKMSFNQTHVARPSIRKVNVSHVAALEIIALFNARLEPLRA